MPGFDRNRIIGLSNDDLEEFICGICLEVFIKPTVTECCGQTYCFDCINEWLAVNNSCPNDRKTLSANQLKSSPKMVSNLLSNMKIKCNFHESGCHLVVKISDLDKHTNDECLFNPNRKCLKCGLAQLNHTDLICNQELFRKYTEVSGKLDKLQMEHDQSKVKQEMEKLETNSYIDELLNKIKSLETKCNDFQRNNIQLKQNNIQLETRLRDDSNRQQRSENDQAQATIANLRGKLRDHVYKLRQSNVPENAAKAALIQKFRDQGIVSSEVALVMQHVDRANYCQNQPYLDKPQTIGFGVNISAPHMHARVLEFMKDKLIESKLLLTNTLEQKTNCALSKMAVNFELDDRSKFCSHYYNQDIF